MSRFPHLSMLSRRSRPIVLQLLRAYQRFLSPFFTALGAHCRFQPSCSQYMIDAVNARGPLRGLAFGLWRILRCNPFNPGGYDPAVPPAARPSSSRSAT